MKRLVFGGSFNPIHCGHLICARAVAEWGGYEQVVLMPSGQPPHKPGAVDLAPAAARFSLCRLAAHAIHLFAVDDLELQRSGPSYTIDTVRELKRRGWDDVHWMIGADMLKILPSWHRAEELIDEARLVVVARPGWAFDWGMLPVKFRKLEANVVSAPLIDISATEIRQRVKEGKGIEWLVPKEVADYIERERLYR